MSEEVSIISVDNYLSHIAENIVTEPFIVSLIPGTEKN